MKVIYTNAKLAQPAPGGVLVRNPRFFNGPERNISEVYLNGDWPEVAAAYRKIDVAVKDITEFDFSTSAPESILPAERPRRK